MKKLVVIILVLFTVFVKAQAPVMNAINGATAVCASPTAPTTFSTSASNSPTSYSWSVIPSASVVITNASASVTPISFPYSSSNFTLYCSATNSVGASVTSSSFEVSTLNNPAINFLPQIQYSVNTTYLCTGLTRILLVNGADTYTWSTGAMGNMPIVSPTVLGANLYTVTGTSTLTGCQSSNIYTLTIVQPPSFAAGIIATGSPTQGTICIGQSISMSANCVQGNPYNLGQSCSYSPLTGLSQVFVTGNLYNVTANPSVTTIYTVTGNGFGCQTSSVITINVVSCVGNKEIENDLLGFNIYPNPANEILNVEFINVASTSSATEIKIINTLGKVLQTNKLQQLTTQINIKELSNGIYFLQLFDNSKLIGTTKIIKQ